MSDIGTTKKFITNSSLEAITAEEVNGNWDMKAIVLHMAVSFSVDIPRNRLRCTCLRESFFAHPLKIINVNIPIKKFHVQGPTRD